MRNIYFIFRAGNYSQKEREIQEIVAQHKIYRSVLDHTFPILFVIFVGPWSDYYGRKVPLLLSTLGTMLYALFTMICAYHVDTIDPLWMNLISAVPRTLTGVSDKKRKFLNMRNLFGESLTI